AIGRCPEFDLRFTDCFDIDTGALEHLDVMIFSGGNEKRYRTDLLPRRRAAILNFLNRGGRVIVSGNAAKYLPEHPNRHVATEAQPLPDLLMKIYSAN
ncbi:MAG: hypothetical protein IJJ28_02625, partial [Lentisphaeria bacterium]|nr:hypothetical protein [Lentisphaeria bacterium]